MPEDRAQTFLQMIRRSQRGRLKVYLGYGPGVGKTYRMLQEAHRLKGEGIDVVVGFVETHGRAETAKLIDGLEVIPRRKAEYHDIIVEEMDVDAVINRHPQVAIVDELAHTNVPGSRNAKRYQDVQDILAAGIHVISALNIQHLESLYNTVEQLDRRQGPRANARFGAGRGRSDHQHRPVRRRPAAAPARGQDLSRRAHAIVAGEFLHQLQSRAPARIGAARIGQRSSISSAARPRRTKSPRPCRRFPDQIMVCLSSRGPNSARLLRFASRLAGRLNRNWYAVYVQTPSEEPTVIDAVTQRLLADTLTLANQLGAMVFTFKGQNVADTILRFAREYRVGQIVIGRPRPVPWWKRLIGHAASPRNLIQRCPGRHHHRRRCRERRADHRPSFVEPSARRTCPPFAPPARSAASDAPANRHLGRSRRPAGRSPDAS